MGLPKERTETESELWRVQENRQNRTSPDSKSDRRHGARRKGEVIQRFCRRGFLDERPTTTLDTLRISSVLVADMGSKSMHLSIPITCKTVGGNKTVGEGRRC